MRIRAKGENTMTLEDLPQPIKDLILNASKMDDYEPLPNSYSITEIICCLRKIHFRRTLPKKQIDLKSANNFFRGNLWDRTFTSQFKRNQVRSTYRCTSVPISISGKFDFIDENGILTDLKCPASLFFVKREGKVSPQYEKQILFYCYTNAIPQGQIMYWDGAECLKIPVEVTEENCYDLIREIENKATILYEAKQTGKAPTREQSKPEEWECKCCDFQMECLTHE
jgi:hypothetical protein